jgi:hypothetical protein
MYLPCSNFWLHLNYEWLQTSAERARAHINRGNSAAKLVVSYCNRQTEWESPDNEMSSELASDLHQAYPEAVQQLIESTGTRLENDWLKERSDYATLLFRLQNKGAIAWLKWMQGMRTVRSAVLAKLTNLPPSNAYQHGVQLDIFPNGWEHFESNEKWPVLLSVQYADRDKSTYQLSLCWAADAAETPDMAQVLRAKLATIDDRFNKHADSRRRQVEVATEASLKDLVKHIGELNAKLEKALM